MQRTASFLVTLVLAALLPVVGGCNMKAAYPQQDGWTQLDPFLDPVPQVMARSLDHAHANTDPSAPLIWNLPSGMQPTVWSKMATLLGSGASAMTSDSQRVWSVERVRVNGSLAEVDVVWRTTDGIWQLLTVHLEGAAMAPYRVTFLQRWRLPVTAPECHNPLVRGGAASAASTGAAAAPSKDSDGSSGAAVIPPAPAVVPAAAPEKP